MKDIEELLIDIVKEDSSPALGCTEPVAVAFASAFAKKYTTGAIKDVRVTTSKSIFKNGKSVMIPKANGRGLDLAAALGVVGGNADYGFMVLKDVDEDEIENAKIMVKEGISTVNLTEVSPSIYVNIVLTT